MKKGCLWFLAGLAAAIALEWLGLGAMGFERPWYVPVLLGVGVAIVASNISGLFLALRRFRASRRGPSDWRDGVYLAVSGRVTPVAEPLKAPFSGRPVVMYEYEIHVGRGDAETRSAMADFTGFGMAPCVVHTHRTTLRLIGFPILAHFPKIDTGNSDQLPTAAKYLSEAVWTPRAKTIKESLKQLEDVLADSDGDLKVDFVSDGAAFKPLSSFIAGPGEVSASDAHADDTFDETDEEDEEEDPLDTGDDDADSEVLTPEEYYLNALHAHSCSLTEQVVLSGAEITAFGTYHANPPRLEIGSGFRHLSHAIHPGALGAVLRTNALKYVAALLFWGCVTAVGHFYAYELHASDFGIDWKSFGSSDPEPTP